MGTTQVKEKAKEMDGFTFNAQALQIDNYIKTLVTNLQEHIEQHFTQKNIQVNQNVESNFKDKSVEKHCNEDFIAGYATSEHLVKLLKDACKQTHNQLLCLITNFAYVCSTLEVLPCTH